MRVALVQPPVFWTTTPPLGPAYLAGEVVRAGGAATIFDFNIELFTGAPADYAHLRALAEQVGHESPLRARSFDEVVAALERGSPADMSALDGWVGQWVQRLLLWQPDVIGVSVHEESWLAALLIADRLRRAAGPRRPRVLAGGPEAVFLHHDARPLARGLLDGVVVGEGEGPLREIIRRVREDAIDLDTGGLGHNALPGAIIRSDSSVLLDAVREASLVDIHTIPTPVFDGLPLDRYSFARTLPIVASRGCPAKCTFCFETVMWARFRLRRVEDVVEEVRARLRQYGAPLTFRFNDSLLNGDLDWLERFADRMVAEGLDIKWHGNARIHPRMTRTYLDRLAAAGLTGLLYGVESGSDAILRRMKKGVRAADIPRVLRDTHEAGIWTHGFFILGFPGETDREALRTLDLLLDQLESLDSLVFHDFAMPAELAAHVDFAGRVPMDDPAALFDGRLLLQSNVAAVRPWLQTFLARFLEFAHRYGHLHWQALPARETRGVLDLYRRRWRQSPMFAEARAALAISRAIVSELDARSLAATVEAAGASGRRLLTAEGDNLVEQSLSRALGVDQSTIERLVSALAIEWPPTRPLPSHEDVLRALAQGLSPAPPAMASVAVTHETLAPAGFR